MPRTASNSKGQVQLKCQDLANRCELIIRAQQHMLNLRDKNLIKKLAIHLKAENVLDNLHLFQFNFAGLQDRHQNILDEIARLCSQLKSLEQASAEQAAPTDGRQGILPSYQFKL